MSKIKFTLLDIEAYDHDEHGTQYDLAFSVQEQDLVHTKRVGTYKANNGLNIMLGAYPYIANYISNNSLYIIDTKDNFRNSLITSVRFKTEAERHSARIRIIEALKEWSQK